jgi:hypothetical protein
MDPTLRNYEAISRMQYDRLEEPLTRCKGCGEWGDTCVCRNVEEQFETEEEPHGAE